MKKSHLIGALCALFFSFFCSQALAAATKWEDGPLVDWPWLPDSPNKIDEITQNVVDIRNDVGGNAREVANDLKDQLDELVDKGVILKESVKDILIWLQTREQPYREFIGGDVFNPERCNLSTPCHSFRIELSNFFLEIADQGVNFQVIEKVGLDGSRAENTIMKTPPIILFALYEVMNRMPDWRKMPGKLQSIFDEIGDPDVFSVRLEEIEDNLGKTPTQRFCDRWEKRVDKELDPVRLNRIELYVYTIRQFLNLWNKLIHETVGVTLVGEGNESVIPNPLRAYLALAEITFDVVQRGAQTFRDNLNVCRANRREIEIQIAECLDLVDFILPSKRDDIYNLVKTKVENAGDESIPVAISQKHIASAEVFREKGKWKKAYKKLCVAYKRIGDD